MTQTSFSPAATASPAMLRVEFVLAADELREAQALASLEQVAGHRKSPVAVLAAFVVVVGVAVLQLSRMIKETTPVERYVWIGIFLIIWMVVLVSLRRRNRRAAAAQRPVVLEVYPTGLQFDAEAGRSFLPWSDLASITDRRRTLVISHRLPGVTQAIPKRAFDEPTLNWFKSVVSDQISFASAVPRELAAMAPASPGGPDPDDERSFQPRFSFADGLELAWASWFTRGLMALAVGISAIAAFRSEHDLRASHRVVVHSVWTIFPFFTGFFILISYAWSVGRELMKCRRAYTDVRIKIDDVGMTFVRKGAVDEVPWDAFDKFLEGRRFIALWRRVGGLPVVLPKSSLMDGEHLQTIRQAMSHPPRPRGWLLL